MWNPFSKIKKSEDGEVKLNFLQRMAMKKFEQMNSEEKEKVFRDAFDPKNRKKLLKSFEEMEKSGMVSKSQLKKAKERMGIYE